jgi:hypothetical protein
MEGQQHQHYDELKTHCRLCGVSVAKQRVTYSCKDHTESLIKAFGIDTRNDEVSVHPVKFCQKCYCKMRRSASLTPFQWFQHTHPICPVRTSR